MKPQITTIVITLLIAAYPCHAQKMDGTDTLVPPPAREFQSSNTSDLINLVYQALPLSPIKSVILPPEIEVAFNFPPGTDKSENLTAKILEKLQTAESEILFTAGAITAQEVAAALVEQKLTGKIVAGIMSESPSGMKNYTAPSYFIVNNLPIFFDRSKLVNGNNFFVIDRQAVIIVSTNLTRTQLAESSSFLIYIKDPGIAVAFYNAWIEQLRTSTVPRITQSVLNTIVRQSGRVPEAGVENANPNQSDPWGPPVVAPTE